MYMKNGNVFRIYKIRYKNVRLYAIFHVAKGRSFLVKYIQQLKRNKNKCLFASCVIKSWISLAQDVVESKSISCF